MTKSHIRSSRLLGRIAPMYRSLILFLLSAVVILLFAPREHKFMYFFVEGKPWQYELLTAPYSFPVYKPSEQLEEERDSVRNSIRPYYTLNESIGDEMLEKWETDFQNVQSKTIDERYRKYISDELRMLYSKGIITDEELSKIRNENNLRDVNLMVGNTVEEGHPIGLFYNVKEAYLAITKEDVPDNLDLQVIASLNTANYLKPNVLPNDVMRARVLQEEIQNIPNSTGVVQSGQRIVDKGEIVDSYTYNVLNSFKKVYESRTGTDTTQIGRLAGTFVIVVLLLLSVWLFILSFVPKLFDRIANTIFIVSGIIFFTVLTELAVSLSLFSVYVIPYVIFIILLRTFFHSRTAFFVHMVMVLTSALFVPFPMDFILLQTTAGMTSMFSLKSLTSRAQLIKATFLVFISYVVISLAISIMQNGLFESTDWENLLYFGINLIFLMFTYTLVYPVEKLFGYVSNISLVEMSDVNTPLLRQLSERAPGTFQHSMQVSILATEAAQRIGADVQLTRTGALYHDIGKMLNPSFFTENQGAVNPHDRLDYKESAAIIVAHITDGAKMAEKNKLPQAIRDFILTHHGRGVTKYFYTKYCNEHPDETPDPTPFTYPGPNPFTKETGILMLADACEAASRSLKEYNEQSISELVNRIIDGITDDRLLDETPLSFRDISQIKQVFIEKLQTIYHARIAYPKMIYQGIESTPADSYGEATDERS